MEHKKKDAAQDVMNLYNKMKEEEATEDGKSEINATIEEIESAKVALASAKKELANANHVLEKTRIKLTEVHGSTVLILDGIAKAITLAKETKIKVGLDDNGLAQLNERNNTAITAFKQALDGHEKRINALFAYQQKELKRIRNIEEGAYFNGKTYAWMFGLTFIAWLIIFVEITLWICFKLG